MASSSNFVFLVTFMVVALLVVQDSAAQQCLYLNDFCDIRNQSSCCSGICESGFLSDGNNGTCWCSTLEGPCRTLHDCCLLPVSFFPRTGLLTCSNSRCTVVPPLPCTPRGPCRTNDDCCDPSLPQAQVSICSDYKCTVGPRPTCSPYLASCDTRNQSSCCSGLCMYRSLKDNIGTCGCTLSTGGPCATNADCCEPYNEWDQLVNLDSNKPLTGGCMNSRCV